MPSRQRCSGSDSTLGSVQPNSRVMVFGGEGMSQIAVSCWECKCCHSCRHTSTSARSPHQHSQGHCLIDRGNSLFAQCVSWGRPDRLPLHMISTISSISQVYELGKTTINNGQVQIRCETKSRMVQHMNKSPTTERICACCQRIEQGCMLKAKTGTT